MTDRTECLCGRPLRPCPCGWDWCTTCDPGNGDTLEQRIADTIRGVEDRHRRDLDHYGESDDVGKAVPQAVAELVDNDPHFVLLTRSEVINAADEAEFGSNFDELHRLVREAGGDPQ